jgi:hypothetical protein
VVIATSELEVKVTIGLSYLLRSSKSIYTAIVAYEAIFGGDSANRRIVE